MITPSESFALSLIVKATAVFCVGAFSAFVVRRKSASVQRAVWALTLAGAAGLPLGLILTPAWRVAVLPSATALPVTSTAPANAEEPSIPVAQTSVTNVDAQSDQEIVASSPTSIGDLIRPADVGLIVAGIWAIGVLAVLCRMAIGLIGLRRVTKRAVEISGAEWFRTIEAERALAGIDRRVRALASADVSTPLTFGFVSPVILLPEESSTWTAEHRAVVIRHEMAHIASGDIGACLVAGFACAIYWFHPLAWIASSRLRRAQERACDNQVLTLGVAPADYAGHLLEVARSAKEMGMPGFVSVAMARPSQLEGRLLAVLNDSDDRGSLTPRARMSGIIVAVLLVVSVSAFSPVHRSIVVATINPAMLVEKSMVQTPRAAAQLMTSPANAVATEKEKKAVADSLIEKDLAVAPGGTLFLDLETGAGLTIRGVRNSRNIHMRATLGGRDWRNTAVSLVKEDGGARLTLRWIGSERGGSSSHRIELSIPQEYSIRLKSAGGGLDLADVSGDFTGNTGGGDIRIERANGSAALSTGGGRVTVTNSNMTGSVSTGGGGVLIQGVNGDLRGSSGSGNVLIGTKNLTFSGDIDGDGAKGSDGKVYVRKSGGAVTYGKLDGGADISTGGGRITIASANGDVAASTGGGDISVGTVTGSAELSTGAGDVSVSVTGPSSHRVKVTSGNGKVFITVPADLSANLDLETGYTQRHGRTRIESDWNIPVTETSDWDDTHGTPRRYVRSRTTIGSGSGGTIRVRTTNGDIVLRRDR